MQTQMPLGIHRLAAWLGEANAGWAPVIVFAVILLIGVTLGIVNGCLSRIMFRTRRSRPIFGPLTYVLASLPPAFGASAKSLRKELRQAGRYQWHAYIDFLAMRNAMVLGVLLLVWCVADAASIHATKDPRLVIIFLGCMIAMVLFSMPRLALQSKAKSRVWRIQSSIPDALDMVTMCMTGGLSLLHSLKRVGAELKTSHPDLAVELSLIHRHAEAYTLEHAMRQFADRIDVTEVESLATLVSQTERLGANVGAALMEFADGVRRAFRQRAEERGNRTSVKMLLPVALCLAPPVYILLLAPALLELQSFVTRENRPGGVLAPADAALLQQARQSASLTSRGP